MALDRHYVPILCTKRGELSALAQLKGNSRDRITPLIDFTRFPGPSEKALEKLRKSTDGDVSWKQDDKLEGKALLGLKTLEKKAIDQRCKWIASCLRASSVFQEIYVDIHRIPFDAQYVSGSLIEHLFEHLRSEGLWVIPVTHIGNLPALQELLRKRVVLDSRGLCLRINFKELIDRQTPSALRGLRKFFGLKYSQIDLVVDLGPLDAFGDLALVERVVVKALRRFLGVDWRSIALAAGSMPKSFADFEYEDWTPVPRKDWTLWQRIANSGLPRIPRYSDHGTEYGIQRDSGGRASASLRYSAGDHFQIWRGHLVNEHTLGYSQIFKACKSLVAQKFYSGEGFSAGDRTIFEKATKGDSPGTAHLWRQWTWNHHLELVVSQLASLPEP